MNRTSAYPGFWAAVLLCGAFVMLQVCFLIPVGISDVIFRTDLTSHPAALGVVNLIACAVVLTLGRMMGRVEIREVIVLRDVSRLTTTSVIIASAGAIILLSEADNLVRALLPPPEWIVGIFRELGSTSKHLLASVFLMVIVAPLTEEIMFRGLILRGFLRRFNLAGALVASSLLFGVVHLNPWQFVSASALGLMFAWWYWRTQSLIPSLLGHALTNAMALGNQSLPFRIRGFNAGEAFGGTELQPVWFDALGLLLLVCGLWIFHRTTPSVAAPVGPIDAHPSDSSASNAPPVIPPDHLTSQPTPPVDR